MNIEIVEKKDNPLLERTEVTFRVQHLGDATPKREDVREKLAGVLGTKKTHVVVTFLDSRFGRGVTEGAARVYANPEAAGKFEREYLLKRNHLEQHAPKKKEA